MDDPRILTAAYWLHFQLGRDDQVKPDWLIRASELSSTDEGPVWRIDLPELAAEIPRRQNHLREIERKWLSGEIPMSLAAGRFNLSMARLLLDIPRNNEKRLDGRSCTRLPIIAGNRETIEVQNDWTVGLDVSSILILSYLDLLKPTIEAIQHIKLAPDVMEFLFLERGQVRFQQPSRIRAAKQVRELHIRRQLQVESDLIAPPNVIAGEEVSELAALLQTAKHGNGKLICVLPIHEVGSLMEELGEASENNDDLIGSTADLCRLLYDEGKIDAKTFQGAVVFLSSQGQMENINLSASVLNGPIYLDRVALSYLQYAGVLSSIAGIGLDIRIHPDVLDDKHALIDEGDVGDYLVTKIEGIRHILRNALDSGEVSFLPHAPEPDEGILSNDFRFQATVSLLMGSATCDALCFDDRYINSRSLAKGPTGESVPIVCILDVMYFLLAQGCIDVDGHWAMRHTLRRGGYAFVPLEPDELVHWLKHAKVQNGELNESVELRSLRQSIAHAESLDMASPAEAVALSGNLMTAGRQAISNLWEDENVTVKQAAKLSDWVWRFLIVTSIPSRRRVGKADHANWVREIVSSSLACLLLPVAIQSQERRAPYSDWIEQSVLQGLRPANGGIIEKALEFSRAGFSTVSDDKRAYGHYFLAQLPAAVRKVAIAQDAEFARRCGFEARRLFGLGPGTELADRELFATAKAVLATRETRSVRDIAGSEVTISFDVGEQHIVAKWLEDDVVNQASIPDLTILSPAVDARVDALGKIIDRIGPTATDFNYLLRKIETRELNDQEISAIFNESANGVTAFQTRLIQKINHDHSLSVTDVIPRSIAYFEKFAGPEPGAQDQESYFREVLVPYRKELLGRNLRAGLDICCLGALHDDLSPGQWVADIENDAIWDAFSSCHAKNNPFSLLGALDVALYRQEDPRFREFAADAIAALTDERLGQRDAAETYRLLRVFAAFVLNRINLLEGGPTKLGYWKRMGAWMHAGLITRSLKGILSVPEGIDDFEQWAHSNMLAAGAYADLVYANKEPVLFAGRLPPLDLRIEILARLDILRSRHEREGREVSRSEDIDHALTSISERGESIYLGFPGPVEGNRRPTEPLPEEVSTTLGEAWDGGSDAFALQSLVAVSRYFSLGELELEYAREIVKSIAEKIDDADLHEGLTGLELAGFIVSATQDVAMRDRIGDAVVKIAPRISEEEDIQMIVRIMLQTAAGCKSQESWFIWLEERLANIAGGLPSSEKQCLQLFLDCLNEISVVLPVELWFHLRARSIALAGVV